MAIRAFTSQLDEQTGGRPIDDDSPPGLRQEFIDAAFHVLHSCPESSGTGGGYTDIVSREPRCSAIGDSPTRDSVTRLAAISARPTGSASTTSFAACGPRSSNGTCKPSYRTSVNRILAAHRIAWDLGEDGQLHRVLPLAAQTQIETAFRELSHPGFAPALQLFHDAMAAYDDRPQRDRDTCSSSFDALESVAKIVF